MKFKLEIEIVGAAFEDNPDELRRIIADVAEAVSHGRTEGKVREYNGNTVGSFWHEMTAQEEQDEMDADADAAIAQRIADGAESDTDWRRRDTPHFDN